MKIKKINGETVKGYVEWLKSEDMGCCHFNIGDTENYQMHICVGWHDFGDGYAIAWKIGMETFDNAMQCDLDWDFVMPSDDDGNVYDTLQEIMGDDIDWDALAAEMNETAERVYKWQLDYEGSKKGEGERVAA